MLVSRVLVQYCLSSRKMVRYTQLLLLAELCLNKKRISVTDLETLAVVWAVSHFHAYLYGHDVEVRNDHSAVKAVLSAPSPNGKHARWWSKVYSSGVRSVTITHHARKENLYADALSRNPHDPPPVSGIGEGEGVLLSIILQSEIPRGCMVLILTHRPFKPARVLNNILTF